jgi:hypothetical protein
METTLTFSISCSMALIPNVNRTDDTQTALSHDSLCLAKIGFGKMEIEMTQFPYQFTRVG